MAYTPQQRSWCVVEFGKTNNVTIVQGSFRHTYHNNPHYKFIKFEVVQRFSWKAVHLWSEKGNSWCPAVSVAVVDRAIEVFVRSTQKSTRRSSQTIPRSTVQKVLRKRLMFIPCKLQLPQQLHPQGIETSCNFCHGLMKSRGKLSWSIVEDHLQWWNYFLPQYIMDGGTRILMNMTYLKWNFFKFL